MKPEKYYLKLSEKKNFDYFCEIIRCKDIWKMNLE